MANHKRPVSGPGAADFLTAPGGEDHPGVSPSNGDREGGEDSPLTDSRNLEPDLGEGRNDVPRHTEHGAPRGRDE